jgi:hypothetical protein
MRKIEKTRRPLFIAELALTPVSGGKHNQPQLTGPYHGQESGYGTSRSDGEEGHGGGGLAE